MHNSNATDNAITLTEKLIGIVKLLVLVILITLTILVTFTIVTISGGLSKILSNKEKLKNKSPESAIVNTTSVNPSQNYWVAPNISTLANNTEDELIRYGKELITNTSEYLGPKGSVMQISNGMNCQNCHLEAGTKVFGNNYGAVYANYPKYRARSGKEEDVYKRINDCMERSLNGKPLKENSKEMQAIKSYIEWLGKDVVKGTQPEGSGIYNLSYLNRAADPEKGRIVYEAKCQSCHQANGEGILNSDKTSYMYPPLWGNNSYNDGAGLYRISRFAGFVKYNMPLGASHNMTLISDEEAWDVAAFVNSQPRPKKDISKDWPKIEEKPVDHPFGTFADGFSEVQHKYGPFIPIKNKLNELKASNASALNK